MKKVMIGILIVVPIIIVLAVSLVSVFVSTRAHIGVENVVLDKNTVDIGLTDDIYRLDDLLTVTVLPDRATDKSYTWTVEDVQCLDTEYGTLWSEYEANKNNNDYTGAIVAPPATLVDNSGNAVSESSEGLLKVNAYCSFYVVAHAETMSARCLVYVVGYEVESVRIEVETSLKVGESSHAEAVYNPVDSIVTDTVWLSSDESVVKVDANGVITAVSAGSAVVTVQAKVYQKDEYVTSSQTTVTVWAGATALGDSFAIGSGRVALSALGLTAGDVVSTENCTVDGTDLVVTNTLNPARFTTANGTATVTVCGENDISIEHADLFGYDEDAESSYVLAVGEIPLALRAVWKSAVRDGAPEVTWTSSVPAVASIDANGRVSGKKSGMTLITATCGEKTFSFTLSVEEKVTTLLIDTTDSSLAVGIAKETVFASMDYVEPLNPDNTTTKNNSIVIGFLRPFAPEDPAEAAAFYNAYTFKVTENGEITDKAYFDGNVLYFDSSKISGEATLLITVSAKYPKYKTHLEYTTCSFTVKVVEGVEVNSYAEMLKAVNEHYVVCLGSDIKMLDGLTTRVDWTMRFNIFNNVYGNNHTISAEFQQMDDVIFQVKESNVTISNIKISANVVQEEITDADGNSGLTGTCICFGADNQFLNRLTGLRLEYSIVENASCALRVYGVDVTIEGCIVRNTQGTGIFVPTNRNTEGVKYSNIVMKNCVMSNLIGTGFSFQYDGFSNPKDENSVAIAEQMVAEGKNTTLTQEGFLDIYNWQATNVLTLIDKGTVSDEYYNLIQIANAYLQNEISTNPVLVEQTYEYKGTNYFHLGFVSTGLTEKSYLEVTFEDKRFSEVTSESISILSGMEPIRIFTYGGDATDLTPGSTYTVNAKLIARLNNGR